MIYVDCDGVILDTEQRIQEAYNSKKVSTPELKIFSFIQSIDWKSFLREARILGNSVDILKSHSAKDATILTKVCSMEEGKDKIDFFREIGIRNNIIIVPPHMKKTEVVDANGNPIIEDSIKNLIDWKENGGYGFYYGSETIVDFPKISSIEDVFKMFL